MTKSTQSLHNEFKQLHRNRVLLVGAILLLVCVIAFVSVQIAVSKTTEQITPQQRRFASALTPSFDTSVLEKLESKRYYTDEELSSFTIYKLFEDSRSSSLLVVPIETDEEELVRQGTPTPPPPRPSPTPDASPSAQTATPAATTGLSEVL